ncbi:MAG: DVUA0089 family protein [Candidatus Acidiferrales bacterium]
MKNATLFALVIGLLTMVPSAFADGTSYTGTLPSSTDTFEVILTLSATSDVTLQTYGFGGGTNQAGTIVPAGGTDPFLAIFAGTGDSATILTDAFLNPFGTSLDISNYSSFVGCPSANTVSNFGGTTCGDVLMTLSGLTAGTYTIILTDGQYIANAIFDNGTLGEGFTDLTGGVFCNLADFTGGVETDCPNTSGAFALDITGLSTGSTTTVVPEPGTLLLLGSGLVGISLRRRKQA